MATEANMTGKTCLITGATSGIGRETAIALARAGATVALVARDPARGASAAAEVRAAGGGREAPLFLADLSSMKQVRRLASEALDRLPRLDVLVNNAGAINGHRQTTPDGFELTFAVNHLAYFLLTSLLLERLRACAPSRVVSVSSDAHRFGHLDFDDLQGERRYSPWRAYAQSKLANVLFTAELARRLEGSGVTANSLHPGTIASAFGKTSGGWGLLFQLVRPLLLSPERGARTSIYLARSPEVEGVSGRYFARCRPVRPSREARDPGVARRLWDISDALTSAPGAATAATAAAPHVGGGEP